MRKSFIALVAALPLTAAAHAQDEPAPPWSSSLGAGLAITAGNSDTTTLNVSAGTLFDPKTGRIFKADAIYLRGEAEGETQVDKSAANARYEASVDRRFWFGELSYLRDPFKGIDHLISPIAGVGYHLIKTEARTLSIDGGAGAVFESTPELGSETSAAIRAGEVFEWAISETSRFTQRLNGLWKADDLGDAFYHFDAGIATTLAARAELKVSYVYDYKNQPPPEFEKGDSALFAAVLYKF